MIKVEIDGDKGIVSVEAMGNIIQVGAELLEINKRTINAVDERIRTAFALSVCDGIKNSCSEKEDQTQEKKEEFYYKELNDTLDSILNEIHKIIHNGSEDK